MTRRGWAALAVLVTSAFSALSLGNALYLYDHPWYQLDGHGDALAHDEAAGRMVPFDL